MLAFLFSIAFASGDGSTVPPKPVLHGAALASTLPAVDVASVDDEMVVLPGTAGAPIVVQYSDWRCPHCTAALPTVLDQVKRVGAELRWRNFPLDGACNSRVSRRGDDHRCALAKLSICAHANGRFNQFAEDAITDATGLYDKWTSDPELQTCVETPGTANRLKAQVDAGIADGLQGTPTFYVFIGERWVEAQGTAQLELLLR
jgi:protein-disulfide isomerase